VAYTVAPPVLLTGLLLKPETLAGVDLSSIRTIGSGSAPLAPWMVEQWSKRFGIEVVNLFGSNEGIALVSGPDEVPNPARRARSFPRFGAPGLSWSNRGAAGMRSRLVDPVTGDEVTDPGVPGELAISGPTLFCSYFRRPELTARAFDGDGFYRTGDLFEIELDDRKDPTLYRFVGRVRDLIIRGGMKIAPEEIESLLAEHPKIAEVAVVGLREQGRLEEEVVTVTVVPREGATIDLQDIREFLKDKEVASYKLPRKLVVMDALPRNPLGKVLKRVLREEVS
jgi:acyl-CoA synthetase (AMP-forming)/AMP-acid ligase II